MGNPVLLKNKNENQYNLFMCIALFSSHQIVRGQSSCSESLDKSQQCVDLCLSTESLNVDSTGAQYGNLLFECLDGMDSSGIPDQLTTCCAMDSNCATAIGEAEQCLLDELSRVRETSEDYLTCIYEAKTSNTCPFADFCISILVGGYGTNAANDFGLG